MWAEALPADTASHEFQSSSPGRAEQGLEFRKRQFLCFDLFYIFTRHSHLDLDLLVGLGCLLLLLLLLLSLSSSIQVLLPFSSLILFFNIIIPQTLQHFIAANCISLANHCDALGCDKHWDTARRARM